LARHQTDRPVVSRELLKAIGRRAESVSRRVTSAPVWDSALLSARMVSGYRSRSRRPLHSSNRDGCVVRNFTDRSTLTDSTGHHRRRRPPESCRRLSPSGPYPDKSVRPASRRQRTEIAANPHGRRRHRPRAAVELAVAAVRRPTANDPACDAPLPPSRLRRRCRSRPAGFRRCLERHDERAGRQATAGVGAGFPAG
jgi:hypothetical protein